VSKKSQPNHRALADFLHRKYPSCVRYVSKQKNAKPTFRGGAGTIFKQPHFVAMQIFNLVDKDGTGSISKSELGSLLGGV